MKKKMLFRCLIGAALGLALSTLITVVISLLVGDGNYYPVVPDLISDCGGELNAVLLQTVFSLLYGAAWAGASAIWEKENWSLFRQTFTHFLICSAATFPIAYFMYWMSHTFFGILSYFGIFFGIYLFIWIVQYHLIKKSLKQVNIQVRKHSSDL